MSKLILTKFIYHENEIQAGAVFNDDNRCIELRIQPTDSTELLDHIYMAKVETIAPNIDAAFVMIKPGIRCYLPLSKIKHTIYSSNRKGNQPLRVGDELIVQVSREAMKGKLPAVSTELSIRGKYVVFCTDTTKVGYSSKLSAEDKQRLAEFLETLLPQNRAYGLIVRTNAAIASKEDFAAEFYSLQHTIENILQYSPNRTCFSCIYQPGTFSISMLESIHIQDMEELVTDQREIYNKLIASSGDSVKIRLYEDKLLPLYKLYQLESELNEIYHEKVWLNSGGFLVIQQTEAFVSIDVNSGKYLSKKNPEEGYRKINIEAAAEIARQLRLRNLSGIILIDFINMSNPDHVNELFHIFQKHLKKDPVKAKAVDITALNIMEVTRKKVRRPLLEDLRNLK